MVSCIIVPSIGAVKDTFSSICSDVHTAEICCNKSAELKMSAPNDLNNSTVPASTFEAVGIAQRGEYSIAICGHSLTNV